MLQERRQAIVGENLTKAVHLEKSMKTVYIVKPFLKKKQKKLEKN